MRKTLIIAEAGVNHNGDIEIAKKLIDTAKKCGADIVKFQTSKLESLVTRNAPMAEYQEENIGVKTTQAEMLKRLLLPYDAFRELSAYCKKVGIAFLSTPFDIGSVDFLEELGCDIWKIPSGEITNYPYLVRIAGTHKPIIMSTGMSTLEEVKEAVELLRNSGAGELTLLHCTTQYPTPYEDVNLTALLTLQREFGCKVGYSDHTPGIEIPVAAVAMGASVIEKHFTLDKNMEGPDHKASLEPYELKAMVDAIRHVERAMGDGVKRPVAAEVKNQVAARKSIIAAKDIRKGELFTENNLTTKRPGSGISPMRWCELLGQKAHRDYGVDELIDLAEMKVER